MKQVNYFFCGDPKGLGYIAFFNTSIVLAGGVPGSEQKSNHSPVAMLGFIAAVANTCATSCLETECASFMLQLLSS